MKLPQHIFALTRNEQRVIIIIMLGLLLGTAGKRYYDRRTHPVPPPVSAPAASLSPAADEEPASPDEAR